MLTKESIENNIGHVLREYVGRENIQIFLIGTGEETLPYTVLIYDKEDQELITRINYPTKDSALESYEKFRTHPGVAR